MIDDPDEQLRPYPYPSQTLGYEEYFERYIHKNMR